MTADRLVTVFVLLAALAGFFYVIPSGTEKIDYGTMSPEVVPTALAWVIVALALVQLVLSGRAQPIEPIEAADLLRAGLIFAITIAMVYVMEAIGFLPAAIVIAASAAFLMRERRPIWFGLTAVGIPVVIWLVVTQLLDRTLP